MAFGPGGVGAGGSAGEGCRRRGAGSRRPSHDGGEREWYSWNLVFAGFQAMHDPPRKGVADAIGLLQAGGAHYHAPTKNMSRREQTMTFTCFVFLDLVSAVQNRGIGCGLFQNKMLVTTVSISAVSPLALVYVPFMQAISQTDALDFGDLDVILGLATTSFALHEGRRRYERRLNLDLTSAHEGTEMV
ncbi:hypothetical protein B0H12DRAFT_1219613 [Mycena haematopus]|nr:hypothetical protein B0H12DRAFT_1219613 [Mycena haematopus]